MAISDDKKRVFISLDKQLLEKIQQVAKEDRRTLSVYLEILIEKHLKEMDKD